jgi:hypothetical protein
LRDEASRAATSRGDRLIVTSADNLERPIFLM